MSVIEYTVVQTAIGRTLTEAEQNQVTMWIGDAEVLIRARLGDLSALDQDVLKYAIRETVLAKLRLPKSGATEESRQIDDVKISRKFKNLIGIDEDWWGWELLAPAATSSAFTIRPWNASAVAARHCR